MSFSVCTPKLGAWERVKNRKALIKGLQGIDNVTSVASLYAAYAGLEPAAVLLGITNIGVKSMLYSLKETSAKRILLDTYIDKSLDLIIPKFLPIESGVIIIKELYNIHLDDIGVK